MTDERLREGMEKYSILEEWAIEDILKGNYPNKFSIAEGYIQPHEEKMWVSTILKAKSLDELQNKAQNIKDHNEFYFELKKAAEEEKKSELKN